MPPQLAALLCIAFIIYVFRADRRNNQETSGALWIPQIWILLASSRNLSEWLNLSAPVDSNVYMEGSPLDRAVYFVLIAAGVFVLIRRKPSWDKILSRNSWIWLYFVFGALSIVWSDYPLVSTKRLIKSLGNVIMALVVLTEKHPYEAVGVVIRRLAFLFLPLSILFIKYYPYLGRSYHRGQPMFTGVTTQKNSLGAICLFCGIYFCWTLLLKRRNGELTTQQVSTRLTVVFLLMIAWLMRMANSATSLACLVMAIGILLLSRMPAFVRNPRRVIAVGLVAICFGGLLEVSLNISDSLIVLLGRRPDLTNRAPVWNQLLDEAVNPLIGAGFESFWLRSGLLRFLEEFGVRNAHNGYLEVYLNLGIIGVFIIVASMFSGMLKVISHLTVDYPTAILRLCFVASIIIYNWTEATFYSASYIWVVFLLGAMDAPKPEPAPVASVTFKRPATVLAS